jgi:hypothetical protein
MSSPDSYDICRVCSRRLTEADDYDPENGALCEDCKNGETPLFQSGFGNTIWNRHEVRHMSPRSCFLEEVHYFDVCECSFCRKIKAGKFRWQFWAPAFRYWTSGWWTLVHVLRRSKIVIYFRFTF